MEKALILPKWLDNIIYEEYKAIYAPCPEEVAYNPNQTYDFAKLYLGTYFPRSFAEAYCIMGQLLENKNYFSVLGEETELNVLDFCCGTGGEIFGMISILQEKLPKLKHIHVDAFDANPDYIRYLCHLSSKLKDINEITINVDINPQCFYIETELNLSDIINAINCQYQIISSFKALNEFIQHNTFPNENVYHKIAKIFLPSLTDNGILILSDLSHKNKEYGFYYPMVMNEGINNFLQSNELYKSIFPYSCYFHEDKCSGCYMQDIVYVTHSKKKKDISKIAYRIISKSDFANLIMANVRPNICRAINSQADKSAPYK